jgi:fluoroacetyl-CoA thioesterase
VKPTLQPGIEYSFKLRVADSHTVPAIYPEASEFKEMPVVFATGFMVGLFEWACIKALNPHLDWPEEQSVGTHIDMSHTAATPPGLEVTARVKLVEVSGRRLTFELEASDGVDSIGKGTHQRFIIDRAKFIAKVNEKARKAGV